MSDDKNNDERILIEKAKAGDAAAFDQLVTEGFYRVYYVAYSWVGDEAAAEDITQETFVRALLSLDRLKNPDSFTSWLYAITRNLAKSKHRERSKESRVLEKLISEYAIMDSTRSGNEKSPRRTAIQTEETLRLRAALAKIEPELREILLLHYAEELSQVEIARQLQLPAYTVCRRLESAYGQLRTLLNSDSLPNLGSLKPSSEAVNRMLMITAAIAGMSATAKAGLLNALGKVGSESIAVGLDEMVAQSADVLSNGYGVSINQPVVSGGGKSIMGKILGTAAGKLAVAAVCVGGLVFAGNNLAGRYDKSLGADKTLSAGKNDPESGRRNGAGNTRRGAGGSSNAAGTDSASRVRGSGSLTSSPALSKKDNTLTCPIVMITGKVTFEDGRPADSAGVELWQNGATYMGEKISERLMARQPVGSDGSYRISAPDGTGIRLELKNAARAVADVKVADAPTSAPTVRTVKQDFVIPAMHTVKGKVVWDDSGEAIAGAKVSLRTQANKSAGWYYDNEIRTTDEAGRFEIVNVATGKVDIGAIADGTAPAFQVINVPLPEGEEIILRLKKATGTIAGELRLMPDETPVAGATISVRGPSAQTKLGLRKPQDLITDKNGIFRLENVGDEALVISAKENNGEPLYNATKSSLYWDVTGKNDTITPAVLNATTGYTVKGRVTDRDTGEGIEGVTVFNNEDHPTIVIRKTVTDKDGNYALHRISNNHTQARVVAEKPGWVMDVKEGVSRKEQENGIVFQKLEQLRPLPEETIVDISMARTVLVSGRIKNKFGIGIPNAEVKIVDKFKHQTHAKTHSEKNGKFEIPITRFSNSYLLIQAKGYSDYSKFDLDVSDKPIILGDVTLADEAVIRGKIVTEDGSPLIADSITLRLFPGDTELNEGNIVIKREHRLQEKKLTLDAYSRYEWRGEEAGDYVIISQDQNYETTISERFTLNAGEITENIDLIVKEKAKVTLSGTIANEDGISLGKPSSISVTSDDQVHIGISSPQTGEFTIRGLKKHVPYKLEYGFNTDRQTTNVVFAENNNIIKLTIPNKVETDYIIAVWDKDTSEPVKGILFEEPFTKVRGEELEVNEVRYALESKPNQIKMKGDDYPWQVVTVDPRDFKPGEKINIHITKGYKISGRIVDQETLNPVQNVSVSFLGNKETSPYSVVSTDSEGRFEAMLPPDKGRSLNLRISPPEPYGVRTIQNRVGLDKTSPDWGDIAVGRKNHLKVKVLESGEKPLVGILVGYASYPVGEDGPYYELGRSQLPTDSSGIVNLENVFGRITIRFTLPKLVFVSKTVDIIPGSEEPVIIKTGSVASRISVNKASTATIGYHLSMTHTDGTGLSFELSDNSDMTLNLQPGEWKTRVSSFGKLSNGGRNRLDSYDTETIIVPDAPTFEKQIVIP